MFMPPYSLVEVDLDHCRALTLGFACTGSIPKGVPSQPVLFRPHTRRVPAGRRDILALLQGNERITPVSREQNASGPARLLKNVFSRESQIWPGIFSTYKEAGLGQLTEQGADTVLLWNPSFFAQFCPLVLNQAFCDLGWGNLGAAEQAMLRGALVKKVNAACPTCPTGIDISQAQYSVRIFAEGLLANCEQTGRILRNLTGLEPGLSSSYEDLWRFTLVNYNAGPGCLSNAVQQALARNEALTWANITAHLEPACQGAIGYVEDISRVFKATPTPTPWLLIGEPLPTATPSAPLPLQPIFTPTPGGGEAFPTPTPPPSGYQPPESTPDETAYPYP